MPSHQRVIGLLSLMLLLVPAGAPAGAADAAAAAYDPLGPYREALAAPEPTRRIEAVQDLGKHRPAGAVALLGEHRRDRHAQVRRAVLGALVEIGGEEALVHLDQSLADPDSALRAEAVRAMAAWEGDEVIVRMRRAAADPDGGVTASAVEILTARDARAHVDVFLPLLEVPDEYVLRSAIQGLREAACLEAIPRLEALAGRYSSMVGLAAVEAIAVMGGEAAAEALIRLTAPGTKAAVRHASLQCLGRLPPQREVALYLLGLAEARDERPDRPAEDDLTRSLAVWALQGHASVLGDQGGRLAALLEETSPKVLRAALGAVPKIGPPEARDHLRRLTGDPEQTTDTRGLALRGFARLAPGEAVPLAVALGGASDPMLRLLVVEVLRDLIDQPPAREALAGFITDPDPMVQEQALRTLEGRADPDLLPVLTEVAGSDDRSIRAGVARVLGKIGTPQALGPLKTLLDDPEPQVRTAAAGALGRLKVTGAREALAAHRMDPDPGVRAAVRKALKRLAKGSS
jgi:HEAT repeat protein